MINMDQQLDFSEFFRTKSEAYAFSDSLSAIIDEIYTVNFNVEKALTKQFGLYKKDILLTLLRQETFNGLSGNALKECFLRWQTMVAKMPTLTITIAFEPNDETLKILADWITINLQRQFLFDITVNKTIIGGATFSYNGKHMDFSIRPTLEKIFNQDKTESKPKPEQPAQDNANVPQQTQDNQSTEHAQHAN